LVLQKRDSRSMSKVHHRIKYIYNHKKKQRETKKENKVVNGRNTIIRCSIYMN
jgi:translation initiation factor IF-3